MKKRKIKALFLILSLCLLFQSCQKAPEESGTTIPVPDEPQVPIEEQYLSIEYTYRTAGIDESVLTTDHDPTYLLLANKSHRLGKDYQPANLIRVTSPTDEDEELELEARAAWALYEMFREMQTDGISDVFVTSAYRSYNYQNSLYDHYLEIEQDGISDEAWQYLGSAYIQSEYIDCNKSKLKLEDAERVVQSYSARAGESEHQTGLCVDLITPDMNQHLTEAFENTEAFAWLSQNAHRFGFILRYPKGKESITGYTYEPWHYRYVGREAATNIYLSGLTLEEYLEEIQK
ncbi:MAG: M15 family metallopeptidase [Clostridia bacterium]|nr:M15 family metallopeptidase [Clostridia bacterium]